MDEDTGPRDTGPTHHRATASASALGAAALLVLSFGPSALALTPSVPVTSNVRAAISAPASASPAPVTGTPTNLREVIDEDDPTSR